MMILTSNLHKLSSNPIITPHDQPGFSSKLGFLFAKWGQCHLSFGIVRNKSNSKNNNAAAFESPYVIGILLGASR